MSGFLPGPAASSFKIAGGSYASNGTQIVGTYSTGITSVTRTSAGRYEVDYTAAGFTQPPICAVSPFVVNGSTLRAASLASQALPTTTLATVLTFEEASGNVDQPFSVFFIGE